MKNASPDKRQGLFESAAASLGEAWARDRLAELAREKRAASGGWPGTISEARSRVRVFLGGVLARERLEPADVAELDLAARSTYARARTVWLASAKEEDAEDEGSTP